MPFELPRNLVACVEREGSIDRRSWVASLPSTVARLCALWELSVASPYQPGGDNAWVAPARTSGGERAVLKVGWTHDEARDEAAGLRVWAGRGAVRLLAEQVAGDTTALLLERCEPGTTLHRRSEVEQDAVVAELLAQLWSAPIDGDFRSLESMCVQWAGEHAAATGGGITGRAADPLDPGLVRMGLELFRTLPTTTDRTCLLTTDLHAGNVLAAQRKPWLVIDPKPYVGDPTYDLLQHMLNCRARLVDDPAALARRLADLAGVDSDRLLRWLFARCALESLTQPDLAGVARQLAGRVG